MPMLQLRKPQRPEGPNSDRRGLSAPTVQSIPQICDQAVTFPLPFAFTLMSLLGAKQARSFYFVCAPWPPTDLRAPIARRPTTMIAYDPEPMTDDTPEDDPDEIIDLLEAAEGCSADAVAFR